MLLSKLLLLLSYEIASCTYQQCVVTVRSNYTLYTISAAAALATEVRIHIYVDIVINTA
jgi:hypothetical protein